VFAPPATGSLDEVADLLASFADAGIGHVQVVLEPSTPAAIESFAPVLERVAALEERRARV
jgi:hypothetical protein